MLTEVGPLCPYKLLPEPPAAHRPFNVCTREGQCGENISDPIPDATRFERLPGGSALPRGIRERISDRKPFPFPAENNGQWDWVLIIF